MTLLEEKAIVGTFNSISKVLKTHNRCIGKLGWGLVFCSVGGLMMNSVLKDHNKKLAEQDKRIAALERRLEDAETSDNSEELN